MELKLWNPSKLGFDTSSLDGLRGISALYIVLGHSLTHCDLRYCGILVVPIFFILSGKQRCLKYSSKQSLFD